MYSDLARKYGLHVSLLERLYDHETYDSGVGQLCKTLLTENHRSHQQVHIHISFVPPDQLVMPCNAMFAASAVRAQLWKWIVTHSAILKDTL